MPASQKKNPAPIPLLSAMWINCRQDGAKQIVCSENIGVVTLATLPPLNKPLSIYPSINLLWHASVVIIYLRPAVSGGDSISDQCSSGHANKQELDHHAAKIWWWCWCKRKISYMLDTFLHTGDRNILLDPIICAGFIIFCFSAPTDGHLSLQMNYLTIP